ncbi:MAG: DUF192 domain-containing protein [Patescibacteria group bacterium]|nr:DUF192 domain-containing protein [Patescibacteria group bacterium]
MRKFNFVLLVVLLFVLIVIAKVINFSSSKVTINNSPFYVTVAQDNIALAQGLSGATKLAANEGMLFIFSNRQKQSFWMKGMLFPLDLIWITDNKIVGLAPNLPIPTSTEYTIYNSPEPIDYVLEINAGTIKKINAKIGDEVTIKK